MFRLRALVVILPNEMYMVSLRGFGTKLANRNESELNPQDFTGRQVGAMNYIPCCV